MDPGIRRPTRSYRTVLRRRRFTILLVLLGCLAAGAVAIRLAPPRYTARSLLAIRQVERVRSTLATQTGYEPSVVVAPMSGHNYVEMLKGYSFARRVSQRLAMEGLELDAGEVRRRLDPTLPEDNLIKIEARDRHPETAWRVANAAAAQFVDESLQSIRSEMAGAGRLVEEKMKAARAEIDEAYEEIARRKRERGIGDPAAERTSLLRRVEEYERQVTDYEIKLRKARARIEALTLDPAKPVTTEARVVRDPRVGALRTQLLDLRDRLLQEESRYTPDHPAVRNLRDQVREWEQALAARVAELRDAKGLSAGPELFLEVDDSLLADRSFLIEGPVILQGWADRLQRTLDEYKALPDAETALDPQRFTVEAAKQREMLLSRRADDLAVALELTTPNVSIVDLAAPPKEAIPRWAKIAFVIAVSLVFAFAAGFLHEWIDTTVHDAEEVETLLGAGPLAVLPRRRSSSRVVRADRPNAPAAESARRLLARIRFAGRERPFRSLLLCGAVPGDGASTVAANLAAVAARLEGKVLLLEADLRRPQLAARLGRPAQPGLAHVLLEGAPLSQAVQECGSPNFLFLPAGRAVTNPAELLTSGRMREVLAELAPMADLLLVDAPAILGASETAPLASSLDAALLVLRADAVPQAEARRARALLGETGARVLGVVLNAARVRSTPAY
ncbi:MAG TPA: hypothetical protein VFI25_01730 [Planctomycetota bacterium]|jgi:capsular exopolysaccharide synthesis family protein|nr:hypothetical protein [Planctomycetota bacterium]